MDYNFTSLYDNISEITTEILKTESIDKSKKDDYRKTLTYLQKLIIAIDIMISTTE